MVQKHTQVFTFSTSKSSFALLGSKVAGLGVVVRDSNAVCLGGSCKTRLAASAIEAEAHAALSGVHLATQMGISHAVFESDSKELVQSVKGHILRSFNTFRNQEISTGAGAIREQQFEEPAVVSVRTLGTGCPVVQTKQQMLQLLKLKGGCVMRFGKPASHPPWSLCCKLMGSHAPLQCEHWLLEADTLPIWEV
ncbi:unnamed protein product [Prunus armeniaca]